MKFPEKFELEITVNVLKMPPPKAIEHTQRGLSDGEGK
jgi:hypothetical protein